MLRFLGVAVLATAAQALLYSPSASAQDNGGLKTAVSVDGLAGFPLDKNSDSLNKAQLRGIEAMFYAPIDQTFDAVVSVAAHPEEDGAPLGKVEVHEAYFGSSKLVPNSRFRVGKFFLGIGRLNQFHQHDWPFITTPIVQKAFIADEGAMDTGVEWSTLLPIDPYVDVTVGYTNGRAFGEADEEEGRPRVSTHYTHIVHYNEPFSVPTQIGFTYLGRTDEAGQEMRLFGLDLTSKKKEASFQKFLWQSELWFRELKFGQTTKSLGGYSFLSYGFDVNWSLGLRLDALSVLSAKRLDGERYPNDQRGGELHVQYRSSEFATFRLAYHRTEDHREHEPSSTNNEILTQAIFIIGAHPAHDF